jgi:hypothetical protein
MFEYGREAHVSSCTCRSAPAKVHADKLSLRAILCAFESCCRTSVLSLTHTCLGLQPDRRRYSTGSPSITAPLTFGITIVSSSMSHGLSLTLCSLLYVPASLRPNPRHQDKLGLCAGHQRHHCLRRRHGQYSYRQVCLGIFRCTT